MEHTKGPWEISTLSGKILDGDDGVVFCDAGTVARIPIDLIAYKANAHLIAAAPEQNVELVSVLRCIERDDFFLNQEARPSGRGVRVFLTYKQIKRIRVAIAKAENGQILEV